MNFLYLFIVAISLIAKIRRTILFLVSWFIVIKIILNKSCFLIRIIEVLTSYIYSWPRYSFFDKEIEKEKERFLFVFFRILLSFFFFWRRVGFFCFFERGFFVLGYEFEIEEESFGSGCWRNVFRKDLRWLNILINEKFFDIIVITRWE